MRDPAKLRLFQEALSKHLARRDVLEDLARRETEMNRARKFMTFAINVSGGGLAGGVAMAIAPNPSTFVVLGVALLGLIGTACAAPRLDRLEEKMEQRRLARRFDRAV